MAEPITAFLENWRMQSRKGLLDLLILRQLQAGDSYGYELSERLKSILGVQFSDGALYSVLSRLTDVGAIRFYHQKSSSGPARKYYAVSEIGVDLLHQLERAWAETISATRSAAYED